MTMRSICVIGLGGVFFFFLVFTVPGEKGLIKAYHLHQEIVNLKKQNASLEKENQILLREAILLKEDRSYIEHTITKEMNLVRPGDTVVIFKKEEKK
jgi:cell division protein FtsB